MIIRNSRFIIERSDVTIFFSVEKEWEGFNYIMLSLLLYESPWGFRMKNSTFHILYRCMYP